jgi:hypothetical protein
MLFGALLAVAGWWRSDQLPPPETLLPQAIVEPIEVAVSEPEFRKTAGGYEYVVRPRYSYEISGLVASLHHSDAWWDTDHRDEHDKLNVADLCMVWGQNASSGVYRRLRFSNTQWTCHVEFRSSEDGNAFVRTQMSNNHVLADSPDIERELMAIRVGEQVRLRGWLVDYATLEQGRIFSTRNTSHGHNGENCEVLYVTSVEHLRPAPHTIWQLLIWLGISLSAVSAVGSMLLAPEHWEA